MECLDGTGSWAALISLGLLFSIFVPVSAYGTYKMHLKMRVKNNAFIKARHPLLSFTALLMNCADLMLIQPVHCALFLLGGNSHSYIMYLTASLLSDVRFVLFGFFFLARIWLLYYDFNLELHRFRLLWKRKSVSGSPSNIGRVLPQLGNPRTVMIITSMLIAMSLVMVEIFPLIITVNVNDYLSLHDSIRIPMFVIEGILLLVLLRRVQSVGNDRFKIRLEIVCILCIPGLLALIYIAGEVMFAMNWCNVQEMVSDCGFFLIYAHFMLLIVSLSLIIQTLLPLQLHKNQVVIYTL